MKRFLAVGLAVAILLSLSKGGIAWEKKYDRGYGDAAESVQVTDGGYIVAGETSHIEGGPSDIWLIKTDTAGNKLWDKIFGGPQDEHAESVQRTTDGGYIIAGYITYEWPVNNDDAWVIKTDANGNMLWDKTFGEPDVYEEFHSVLQATDGAFILAGHGTDGAWLLKIDANGNTLWHKTFGAGCAQDVQQTRDGGYILAGWNVPDGVHGDVWLIKTDANGNKIWDKTFGGPDGDGAYSVQQTTDGGYILAGATQSYAAGEWSCNDVWLIKTDANGNKIWDKTFGGPYPDQARSVQQTTDGGYILAGWNTSYRGGQGDAWLIKTDANGNMLWDMLFGSESYGDGANSIQLTPDDGYIIAGWSYHSWTMESVDAYLIKLNATIAISGYVWDSTGAGIGGVIMDGLPNNPSTDDSGYYAAAVPRGWAGHVTPRHSCYRFSPSSVDYPTLTIDKLEENYTGELLSHYTISGSVRTSDNNPLSGVTMNGLPGNPVTGVDGYYETSVPCGWSGVVSPAKTDYAFSPPSMSYRSVMADQTGQNYTALPQFTMISLSPASLSSSCVKGNDAPNQSFEVWNSAGLTLSYSVTDNVTWLSCSPTSGTSAGEHDRITVNYATSGLAQGTYPATITISAAGCPNSPQQISVTLVVKGQGELTQITLISPMNGSTVLSPPTFTWIPNGGVNDAFAVDLSLSSPTGPFKTGPIVTTTNWTLPRSAWKRIPAGGHVYWRVRGADQSKKPRTIITSPTWSFYKQ